MKLSDVDPLFVPTGIVVFGQQQGVHSQAQFGAGVRADSAQGYGATAQGGKADLFLAGSLPAPIARTDSHIAGEITRDHISTELGQVLAGEAGGGGSVGAGQGGHGGKGDYSRGRAE